jgi:hypothetical protein
MGEPVAWLTRARRDALTIDICCNGLLGRFVRAASSEQTEQSNA